jgi:hypothetical protein
MAQSKSGPTPGQSQKKQRACSLCYKVAVLEPAFEEELAGRNFVLELCRECYDRAGEDERWLKQQLKLLVSGRGFAPKREPLTLMWLKSGNHKQ